MVDIGEAVLQWRCGRCGYRVQVVSRLDDGIQLFIAVVDRHIVGWGSVLAGSDVCVAFTIVLRDGLRGRVRDDLVA